MPDESISLWPQGGRCARPRTRSPCSRRMLRRLSPCDFVARSCARLDPTLQEYSGHADNSVSLWPQGGRCARLDPRKPRTTLLVLLVYAAVVPPGNHCRALLRPGRPRLQTHLTTYPGGMRRTCGQISLTVAEGHAARSYRLNRERNRSSYSWYTPQRLSSVTSSDARERSSRATAKRSSICWRAAAGRPDSSVFNRPCRWKSA